MADETIGAAVSLQRFGWKEETLDPDGTRSERIVNQFQERELLLEEEALKTILRHDLDPEVIFKSLEAKGIFFITNEYLTEFLPQKGVAKGDELKAERLSIRKEMQIHWEKDVTGRSTSKGAIENFISLFRDRYKKLRAILMERVVLKDVTDLENFKRYEGQDIQVIGMIRDLRESKKGNQIIDIEDLTGSALVIATPELMRQTKNLVNDQVIGVVGVVRGDLIIAREVIEPDIPAKKPAECSENVSVAFTSDIHVGSLLFMEKEFNRFIDWINLRNNGNQREIAESVQYIFVGGDLVDGIGIYPGQEKELAIPDIYKQYDYLAKLLALIPPHIELVVSVGNHDAVRRCEPQPALDDIAGPLRDLPNVQLVGSPCRTTVHGIDILMYHGTSMDSLISGISELTYDQPEKAQIEYLKKRHLCPIYGEREQLAPEEKDLMVIDEVPDVFHCGHVHKNGYANYKGVKIINSGTWQARTDYQIQQGHVPTPCRLPILNLNSMQLKVLNFGSEGG